MTIAHIIFSLQVGGAESMLLDIMSEQIKIGHNIQLIIVNDEIDTSLESEIHKNVKVIKLYRPPGSKNIFYLVKLYFLLYYYKSDIIHSHNVSMGKFLKFIKTRKIVTVHDTGFSAPELKYFDEIVSISDAVKKDLFDVGSCDSIVIHNGIKTNDISIREKSKSQKYKILQISSLRHEKKGQDLAIQALHKLKEQGISNIELYFIGVGVSEVYLNELVLKLDLDKEVKFLGLKKKAYVYKHIKNYNLLIQPSRYEGFGLTIIEGMAAKVPVLVSNIEGPKEVILNGKLGSMFVSEDSNNLAEKILEIMNIMDQEKIELAYNYTLKNFSIENTVKKYIDLYKKILKGDK